MIIWQFNKPGNQGNDVDDADYDDGNGILSNSWERLRVPCEGLPFCGEKHQDRVLILDWNALCASRPVSFPSGPIAKILFPNSLTEVAME